MKKHPFEIVTRREVAHAAEKRKHKGDKVKFVVAGRNQHIESGAEDGPGKVLPHEGEGQMYQVLVTIMKKMNRISKNGLVVETGEDGNMDSKKKSFNERMAVRETNGKVKRMKPCIGNAIG